ncbi:hypothetical protein LCGC14_1783060 [marine sediment metagenome]|uniref:Uncharacterized protein n=1 Tax=marine sediment metagenome TaxID=412755 RepID=A0A0F9GUR4_9ZZZZ
MEPSWLTPEWKAELSRIAATVASRAGDLRDDTHQEIWLQFLRYQPRTKTYAWKAANSARNSLCRKENSWQRVRDEGPEACNQVHRAKLAARPQRPSIPPEKRLRRQLLGQRRRYHADIEKARASGRARTRKHRLKLFALRPPPPVNHPQRNKEIGTLRKNGMRVGDIGKRYGLNDGSIYAALAANREGMYVNA